MLSLKGGAKSNQHTPENQQFQMCAPVEIGSPNFTASIAGKVEIPLEPEAAPKNNLLHQSMLLLSVWNPVVSEA